MKSFLGMLRPMTVTFLFTLSVAASVPTSVDSQKSQVTQILSLPLNNRIQLLNSKIVEYLPTLENLAFSKEVDFDTRWRAVLAIGRMRKLESLPFLERCLQAKEWFIRSAALLAMSQIDRDKALKTARQLLQDPALVVRSNAVDIISKLGSAQDHPALWQALEDKKNFRGKQSLWVRKQITEVLARDLNRADLARWNKIVDDNDPIVSSHAKQAVNKISAPSTSIELN